MATIANLVVSISAQAQGLRTALRQAEGRVNAFAQRVRAQANRIGKWLVGAFTAAAGAVALFVRQGLGAIDEQVKFARQVGATADGMRALAEAGEDAGVSTGILQSAVDRLNSRLGEARRGTGQAKEALDSLGLSAETLSRMDADERLATIADAVRGLGLDSQQTGDLLRQLGIRNREMVLLLQDGGDAIRNSRLELEEYGLTLNNIDTAAVERANDAMRRIGRTTEVVRNRLTAALAPALEAVANLINDAAKNSGGFKKAIDDALATAMEKASGFLMMLDKIILGLQKVQRFQLQAEAFGATLNNLITRSDELPEQFMRLQEIEAEIAQREQRIAQGGGAISGFLQEQAGNIRENPAIKELDQTALNMARIIGQEAVARVEGAQASEGFASTTEDATHAVSDFARSLTGSDGGADSSPTSQFSTWSSIAPRSADEFPVGGVQSQSYGGASMTSVAETASQGESRGRHLGTLTLSSENGGEIDVEANDERLQRWLSNTLSGAAAAV